MKELKIVYFGGEPIGVPVLNELEKAGILPSLVVCNPDKPIGRKHILTSPPVKQWALASDIETFQPESLKDKLVVKPLIQDKWDLFIVVAYNHILPKWLINIPKYGTLNVHPSLLPLLRGASPIRSSILQDRKKTGVTIMKMDEEMDHGQIVAQEVFETEEKDWPVHGKKLDDSLAYVGGRLLASVIPKWVDGLISPTEQPHEKATFCGKIQRADGELDIDPYSLPEDDEAYKVLLKIRAFDGWPGTFFIHKGKRIKVVDAQIKEDKLFITRVTPEGKKETDFKTYLHSL